jgi:hypothetical protein
MNQAPIFLGGAGRSGTTLVVDMLGLHPRLSPVYETDFVIQLARLFFGEPPQPVAEVCARVAGIMDEWTRPLPLRPHNKRAHEQFHHGPHHILFDRPFALQATHQLIQEVRAGRVPGGFVQFVQALFAEHCRRDGKARWVNKTPAYVHCLPLLRALFPAMRFLHCVRDGRDTACSAVTRPWGPRDFRSAASWWVNNVAPAVDFGRRHPEQYFEIRFEDLVRHPAEQLGRMLTWLGEEDQAEAILRHYQEGRVRLDGARIGEWERTFTPEDRQVFHEQAGEMLAHFGYGV